MATRKITLVLTEAEYNGLASAVAIAELEEGPQRVKTLLRAWNKINEAWHGV